MLCHLSFFAIFVLPLGNVLGPLTLWHVKKHRSPFVMDQGKECVNFQISMTIYLLTLLVLSVMGMLTLQENGIIRPTGGCLPIALLILSITLGVTFVNIVLVILGAVKSDRGEYFRYPLNIRFIR